MGLFMVFIIQITGSIGSGKTYLGQEISKYYLENYGFIIHRTSFAAAMKQELFNNIGIYKTMEVKNETIKLKIIDKFIKYIKNNYNLSIELINNIYNELLSSSRNKLIRKIYQLFGTEIIRNNITPDFWVNKVEKFIISITSIQHGTYHMIIIDDYRFPNEDLAKIFDRSKNKNIEIIRIKLLSVSSDEHISEKYINILPADLVFNSKPDINNVLNELDNIILRRLL